MKLSHLDLCLLWGSIMNLHESRLSLIKLPLNSCDYANSMPGNYYLISQFLLFPCSCKNSFGYKKCIYSRVLKDRLYLFMSLSMSSGVQLGIIFSIRDMTRVVRSGNWMSRLFKRLSSLGISQFTCCMLKILLNHPLFFRLTSASSSNSSSSELSPSYSTQFRHYFLIGFSHEL